MNSLSACLHTLMCQKASLPVTRMTAAKAWAATVRHETARLQAQSALTATTKPQKFRISTRAARVHSGLNRNAWRAMGHDTPQAMPELASLPLRALTQNQRNNESQKG
jgi:hypothetical protein